MQSSGLFLNLVRLRIYNVYTYKGKGPSTNGQLGK